VVVREHVEDTAPAEALDVSGAAVVASYVLHGGALSGKYSDRSTPGRRSGELDDPELKTVLEAADALRAVAAELGTSTAALAIAFALANERVAAVLFGATSPGQVEENARAVELLDRLTPAELEQLRAIGG